MTEVARKKRKQQRKIEMLHEKKRQGFNVDADLENAYDELTRLECMESMGIQCESEVSLMQGGAL